MFKIVILDSDAPAALEAIQSQFDITAVTFLGRDPDFTVYLLVQYATKLPPGAQLKAEKAEKAAK